MAFTRKYKAHACCRVLVSTQTHQKRCFDGRAGNVAQITEKMQCFYAGSVGSVVQITGLIMRVLTGFTEGGAKGG